MKVICISGKARAGKDTSAEIIKKTLVGSGHRVLVTHYADLLKYICKTFLNWDGVKDAKGRSLLQYAGTEVIRAKDPNYWVNFILSILRNFDSNWDFVLIPDTRFPNEINVLKENGFDVVHLRIERPDSESELSEEQKSHSSETALDDVVPDFVIENSGTITYLARNLLWFVGQIDPVSREYLCITSKQW